MASPTRERSVYHCEDGTEFPVEWPSAEAPNYAWRWNEDHQPEPYQHLFAVIDHGPGEGRAAAYREADVPSPHFFREFTVANGYQYVRVTPLEDAEMAEFRARVGALVTRHGGPFRIWEAFSLPRAQRACEELRALPPESPVEQAAFLFDYAFHMTHIAGPVVMPATVMPLMALLGETFGPEASLLANEVTQGGANDTITSDQAIWRMGQLAANEPAALRIVQAGAEAHAEIEGLPPESEFRKAFEEYIETYRWRGSTWDPGGLTVGEDPGQVLALVQRAMSAPEPATTTAAVSEQRRRGAIERVEAALASKPVQLSQFRGLVGMFDGYVAVREGRALWQLTAAGSLRHALLKKGAVLVERGSLDAATDGMFLAPEQVDRVTAGATADYRGDVTARKADREFWRTKRPPYAIGAPMPSAPGPFMPPIESAGPVLRGIPASRGVVTAPVRVINDLSEANTFQPGEVLVCAMTSPPWTPLFGIAAAVVTGSGGALSHPAIAAREYGIPCVVAVAGAPRKLRTGEVVTVDGAAGTVTRAE